MAQEVAEVVGEAARDILWKSIRGNRRYLLELNDTHDSVASEFPHMKHLKLTRND